MIAQILVLNVAVSLFYLYLLCVIIIFFLFASPFLSTLFSGGEDFLYVQD